MEKVVIFRDRCIACGACIAFCPYGALVADNEGKPVLLWDLCSDDFACVYVCPVAAVARASQAVEKPIYKWYKLSNLKNAARLEVWRRQYGFP